MTTTIQTIGNLGRDPEMKYFESGASKCTLALALKQKGEKQKDGSWKDPESWWVQVEFWNKAAERIVDKFHKGDTVDVRGELTRETWEKDGKKGEKLVIKFASVDLIKKKDAQGSNRPPMQQQQTPADGASPMPPAAATPTQWNQAPLVPDSNDIPF
jgi:single-strand DNA-binding protein